VLLDLLRERSHTLAEMAALARWHVRQSVEFDEKAVQKHLNATTAPLLGAVRNALAEVPGWTVASLEKAFEQVAAAAGGVSLGKLAQPVRVAITGGSVSPGIHETLCSLGRERSLARIDAAIGLASTRAGDGVIRSGASGD
jgi:glutamyl-tRNA synthetase